MKVKQILDAAEARGWYIAVAESCTGGMLASTLTDPAGAGEAFDRGIVTYSNEAKQELLGVRAETLEAHGAVSEEVAAEMAQGLRERSSVDLTLSITGVAGPSGSEKKPVGRVCFGISSPEGTRTETIEFGARGRGEVRRASVDHALKMLAAALDLSEDQGQR